MTGRGVHHAHSEGARGTAPFLRASLRETAAALETFVRLSVTPGGVSVGSPRWQEDSRPADVHESSALVGQPERERSGNDNAVAGRYRRNRRDDRHQPALAVRRNRCRDEIFARCVNLSASRNGSGGRVFRPAGRETRPLRRDLSHRRHELSDRPRAV